MTVEINDNIDEVVEFETLKDYPNYEIATSFPFTIRNKKTKHVLKENIYNYNDEDGYPRIKIGNKIIRKHILIAKQFIPNNDPEHLTEVDHFNHDRTDYHIENLRWTTHSGNQRNRSKSTVGNITYEYIEKIPDDSIDVTEYNNHEFEFYYYSESTDKFYFYNGQQYKILYVNRMKSSETLYVILMNQLNKPVKVCINKFKKLYDIPF